MTHWDYLIVVLWVILSRGNVDVQTQHDSFWRYNISFCIYSRSVLYLPGTQYWHLITSRMWGRPGRPISGCMSWCHVHFLDVAVGQSCCQILIDHYPGDTTDTAIEKTQYPQSLSHTLYTRTLHTRQSNSKTLDYKYQKHKTSDYVTRDCCCDAWLSCCHDILMISCHDRIKYWSLVERGVSRANSGNWNKNNLEIYMDETQIPAKKSFLLTGLWPSLFLSAVLKVVHVLFPNFLCK